MRNKKGYLIFSGVLVLLLFLSILLGCHRSSSKKSASTPSLKVAPEVGALAPDFTLYDLKGKKLTLSQLRGQKVVLNFWATWCSPCRREMPYLQEAFRQKGDRIKFIGINLGDSADKVEEFKRANGLEFTILVGRKTQDVAGAYNVRYIPTTFFIDEKGIIRQIKIGAFASLSEIIKLLESF